MGEVDISPKELLFLFALFRRGLVKHINQGQILLLQCFSPGKATNATEQVGQIRARNTWDHVKGFNRAQGRGNDFVILNLPVDKLIERSKSRSRPNIFEL